MIHISQQAIDPAGVIQSVHSRAAGAVVLFLGTVRETSEGRTTVALDYECYPEMAAKELEKLEGEARARWPLAGCTIVHRLGHMAVGEVSVAIAVSSAHREAAFAAGQWLIDRVKEVAPIWKKENWVDGSSHWVHPGLDGAAAAEEGNDV